MTEQAYLEKVVNGVVNAKHQSSHSNHVSRPRHHHQRYRGEMVHYHLPKILATIQRTETHLHVSQKNIPDIFDYNLKTSYQILTNFGTNIPDTTCHQMTV